MSYHIRLDEARCVICRHSFDSGNREEVAAVIGDAPLNFPATTLSFHYPAHGHKFQETSVYGRENTESWRLCRVPRCAKCLASPEAFIFHIDCFNVVQRKARDGPYHKDRILTCNTIRQIWLAGYWSQPWTKASYASPAPPCSFTDAAIPASDTKFGMLIEKLRSLPVELQQMIIANSYDSPLWRLVTASGWSASIFANLSDSSATVSVNNLDPGWRRGADPRAHTIRLHHRGFVRFTLDYDGIKSVEFLSSQPSRPPVGNHYAKGLWYTYEDLSKLRQTYLLTQGGLLRFQDKRYILWDNPYPPAWDSCYFFGADGKPPLRVRSILLGSCATGLTAFCAGGGIYGFHTHFDGSSANDTYSRLSMRVQQQVVWLYFPFCPGEFIKHVWIRYRDGPFGKRMNYTLVIQTSLKRTCTFGEHILSSQHGYRSHLICSNAHELLYYDPDAGNAITCFGVNQRMPHDPEPVLGRILGDVYCPVDRNSIYYSGASLEHVTSVQCFSRDHHCIGVLLEYSDQSVAALGQCPVGTSQSVQVTAPIAMYLKKKVVRGSGLTRILIRFISDASEQIRGSDWERKGMTGEMTWWFDKDNVEVTFS